MRERQSTTRSPTTALSVCGGIACRTLTCREGVFASSEVVCRDATCREVDERGGACVNDAGQDATWYDATCGGFVGGG